MSTDRLLARASQQSVQGLWALTGDAEPDHAYAFFLGGILGLSLLAEALHRDEVDRSVERLRRYTPKAVLREVDRMVATYRAGVRQIDGDDATGVSVVERG